MPDRPWNVLVLCTGNSARSILAEALLNALGIGRVRAFSAGSRPAGRVNPHALALLEEQGLETAGLRSKSWDEFAAPGAPQLDLVITVCDAAAGESCPVWPGQPLRVHWGIADPAAVSGSEEDIRRAFMHAYTLLAERILTFMSLSFEELDRVELQKHLAEIGRAGAAAAVPGEAKIAPTDEE